MTLGPPRHRSRTWAARLVALPALMLALLLPVQAQTADPWQDWHSAESAHFRLHYRSAHRAQAERVIAAAERAWPRVTASLQWVPRGRTEIVAYTESDLPNGFTTPLPYNLVGILLSPDDGGEVLDASDWLDLVVTHEFTHVVHLDKLRGAPKVLQAIFGRVPWFFPNAFAPGWTTEGLAVYHEGDAATGRGRLRTPGFEAWLRAERQRGFPSLAELNADGRTLPVFKQYLYGAYFYEFLARRHGKPAVTAFVERYSGNLGFIPRLHSNPLEITGKPMDALWEEFLADLREEVDRRAEPLRRQPETLGPPRSELAFDIGSLAALPGGDALAVVDDGLGPTRLVRVTPEGRPTVVRELLSGTRLSVADDGRVLLSQPDLCDTHYLAFDLYRLRDDGGLQRLTHCAHLRRAVDLPQGIAAVQLDAGRSRVLRLDAEGGRPRTLWEAPDGTDVIDLAASDDGRTLHLITKRGGDWRLQTLDAEAGGAPRTLARFPGPMHTLRRSAQGLSFVGAHEGVFNVWRLAQGQLQRLTHSHTSVVLQAPSPTDGGLWSVVIGPGGHRLHRLDSPSVLQRMTPGPATDTPAPLPPLGPVQAGSAPLPAPDTQLDAGRPYTAWRSLAPRSWLPFFSTNDRGLAYAGASTFGADALGWHRYSLSLGHEFTQREPLATLEYLFLNQHAFALQRELTPRAWTGERGDEDTTVYERATRLQWLSTLPWLRRERRLHLGLGAALDRVERVDLVTDTRARSQDERIAAALVELDTRGAAWWSDGANRGQRSTLLYETYRPWAQKGPVDFDGELLRADLRAYLPLGRTVLALRHTEARSRGRIEPFQLGGASDPQLQFGTVLNQRDLALRGYHGTEPALLGSQARISSLEWRAPLADVDRHAMVPALGLNRVATTLFYEQGGAWQQGHGPRDTARSVGVELRAELRLLYVLGLQLRLGVARGLDLGRDTLGYVNLGHSF